tara:strand:- start:248 stop:517 length:270 start_codon:yes stop_codon:yes gene_type:complete
VDKENIISPCIGVCKTDPLTNFCYGCGRDSDDKKQWKSDETSNEWKINNLEIIKNRLNGWQQEAFKKSYQHKKQTGNSLIKQKFLDSKT